MLASQHPSKLTRSQPWGPKKNNVAIKQDTKLPKTGHGSVPSSVISDQEIALVRRQRSTRLTADDASSVYSCSDAKSAAVLPTVEVHYQQQQQQQLSSASASNLGPMCCLPLLRSLVRRRQGKSSSNPSADAACPQKQSGNRPRRKLQKKNKKGNPPRSPPIISVPKRSTSAVYRLGSMRQQRQQQQQQQRQRQRQRQQQIPSQPAHQQLHKEKGHIVSNSESDKLRRLNLPSGSSALAPTASRLGERGSSRQYQLTAEPASMLLRDRAHATPRTHVRFENEQQWQRQRQFDISAGQLQLHRHPTIDFKPLPTPRPELELPQRRSRICVPMPKAMNSVDSGRSGTALGTENRQSQYARTMPPSSRNQYRATRTVDHDGDGYEEDGWTSDYSQAHHSRLVRPARDLSKKWSPSFDSPSVSPLSEEEGEEEEEGDSEPEYWNLLEYPTAQQTLGQLSRGSTVRKEEKESPLRHTRSVPSMATGQKHQLRTRTSSVGIHRGETQDAARTSQFEQHQHQHQYQHQRQHRQHLQTQLHQHPKRTVPETSCTTRHYGGQNKYRAEEDGPLSAVARPESTRNLPAVYRNGSRRDSELSSAFKKSPYRILHSYYSPAYRNAPIWG